MKAARLAGYVAWFMLWVSLGLAIVTTINPNLAHGTTVLYEAWIYETDELSITIAWEAVPDATYYEVRMESLHPLSDKWRQNVTGLQATFARPGVGLFRYYVRACRMLDGQPDCSEWTRSDGPGSIITKADGQIISQPWMSLFRLAPPIIK